MNTQPGRRDLPCRACGPITMCSSKFFATLSRGHCEHVLSASFWRSYMYMPADNGHKDVHRRPRAYVAAMFLVLVSRQDQAHWPCVLSSVRQPLQVATLARPRDGGGVILDAPSVALLEGALRHLPRVCDALCAGQSIRWLSSSGLSGDLHTTGLLSSARGTTGLMSPKASGSGTQMCARSCTDSRRQKTPQPVVCETLSRSLTCNTTFWAGSAARSTRLSINEDIIGWSTVSGDVLHISAVNWHSGVRMDF
jgi:hypothetical protein